MPTCFFDAVFLILSYGESEVFCLFNNLHLHIRINVSFLRHVKLLERILYGRQSFAVIVKSMFTSRGIGGDFLWGSRGGNRKREGIF